MPLSLSFSFRFISGHHTHSLAKEKEESGTPPPLFNGECRHRRHHPPFPPEPDRYMKFEFLVSCLEDRAFAVFYGRFSCIPYLVLLKKACQPHGLDRFKRVLIIVDINIKFEISRRRLSIGAALTIDEERIAFYSSFWSQSNRHSHSDHLLW